ncbi:hypothetical protein PS1_026733 [Malus domestica]
MAHISVLVTASVILSPSEYADMVKTTGHKSPSNFPKLVESLFEEGYDIVSGGTENHLVWWNLRDIGIDGSGAEKVLESVHIAAIKNNVPGYRTRFFELVWSESNGGSGVGRAGQRLPWLPAAKAKGARGLEKGTTAKTSVLSWEESAKRLEEVSDNGSLGGAAKSLDGDSSKSSWDNSASMLEEETKSKTGRASWEVSRKSYVRKNGASEYGSREGKGGPFEHGGKESRIGRGSAVKDYQSDYLGRDRRLEEANTEGGAEEEEVAGRLG